MIPGPVYHLTCSCCCPRCCRHRHWSCKLYSTKIPAILIVLSHFIRSFGRRVCLFHFHSPSKGWLSSSLTSCATLARPEPGVSTPPPPPLPDRRLLARFVSALPLHWLLRHRSGELGTDRSLHVDAAGSRRPRQVQELQDINVKLAGHKNSRQKIHQVGRQPDRARLLPWRRPRAGLERGRCDGLDRRRRASRHVA